MLTELESLDLYSLMGNFMSLASQVNLVVDHHPMVRETGYFDDKDSDVDGRHFPLDPAGT